MNAEVLEKIKNLREKRKNILDDVKDTILINEINLIEECRDSPNKTQKYLEMLSKYRRLYTSQDVILGKIESELFAYYKSIDSIEGHKYGTNFPYKLTTTDAKTMLYKDPKYQTQLTLTIEYQETVKMLEDIVRNFKDRTFALKNMVELRKIEAN